VLILEGLNEHFHYDGFLFFFLFAEELYKNRLDWYVLTFIFTRAQEKRYNSRIFVQLHRTQLTARNATVCSIILTVNLKQKSIKSQTITIIRQPFLNFYWFCL
jgi:hypothetical protein